MPSFALRNPQSGAGCDIELERGLTYAIALASPGGVDGLIEQLLQLPDAQVADSVGGMVNHLDVLENIALPAVYHGRVSASDVRHQALDAFAACGMDEERAGELLRKLPGELEPYEKRLAGFVRSLLMRPRVLVYSRFFEGLTRADMARAAGLNPVFHAREPGGTAIHVVLKDMPVLQVECDNRLEL